MNLALDIHGVLDIYPNRFVSLAWGVKSSGGKVFIITGESISEKLIVQLRSYNNYQLINNTLWIKYKIDYWDRLISIQDSLSLTIPSIGTHESGRPLFPEKDWNSFKGTFCKENGIDLMIDNSPEYEEYFDPNTTTFLLCKRKK